MTDLEDALDRVLARVDSTEAAVGRRFPIHADPESGVWLTSRRGSWVAGFWAGQLWLRARLSGRAEHVCAAREAAERLVPAAGLDTATRGLILWYGAAAGERLGLSRDPDRHPVRGPGTRAQPPDPLPKACAPLSKPNPEYCPGGPHSVTRPTP
ncbi:hypothetical protein [Nocardia veterana]|uniref:Uncharacterized protein n=1 Tax=Nocardia veterana TaxID=132249 RepID=A0A7X6LTY6_9NOCA|nr:hypothetical protein [Nocardia veterana]NKY84513.1 hypothetical protein [Nocardia veterana]